MADAAMCAPIDPASELGSRSLDETGDCYALCPAGDVAGPLAEDEVDAEPGSERPAPPRMLDLAEFAAMPGRNAVLVKSRGHGNGRGTGKPSQRRLIGDRGPNPPPTLWLNRQAPRSPYRPPLCPASLSAVVTPARGAAEPAEPDPMVERFAAAMHEPSGRRRAPRGPCRPRRSRSRPRRGAESACVAQHRENRARPEGEPLRDALTRLQGFAGRPVIRANDANPATCTGNWCLATQSNDSPARPSENIASRKPIAKFASCRHERPETGYEPDAPGQLCPMDLRVKARIACEHQRPQSAPVGI